MNTDIDAMVAALDGRSAATNEKWDLYRCFDGDWIVALRGDDKAADREARGATIVTALEAAINSPRLPTVPPAPTILRACTMTVAKEGNSWKIVYPDGTWFGRSPTKKAAVATVARIEARTVEAYDAWVDKYGALVANGVEGVDYYRRSM
jgi:hypothetical protein